MPSSVTISNIVTTNQELVPSRYKQRWDNRIHLSIYQETFWNMLLTLLIQGKNTPRTLNVGREKLTFSVEPQEWQSFLTELGLENEPDIEAFRHLLTTMLRGEELQTDSSYTTLVSHLPQNALTLITFIGQMGQFYPPFYPINKDSDYPYEEGKLTDYWYEQISRFTTEQFEERVWFREFCLWANIRLKDNRAKLYLTPLLAFIVPARKALSIRNEGKLSRDFEQGNQRKTHRSVNSELNWNDDPESIARLLKKTDDNNTSLGELYSSDSNMSLFRSRFRQMLAAMKAEFESRFTRELDEFESSYEMLRRELAMLRNMETQKTQETAIKTLGNLLDPILRLNSEQLTQIQAEIEKKEGMTRVCLDNIAVGSWYLVGEIGEIVSEEERDRYLPDPEKVLSPEDSGKLIITRCGLEVDGILLLPPYVTRRSDES